MSDQRYLRQIQARHVGMDHQQRLSEKKILVVGLGGVGSAAALYLSRSGIGVLGLCDHGCVEAGNLHRQILYTTHEMGQRKVDAARVFLAQNGDPIQISGYHLDAAKDLERIGDSYDLILDCLDNRAARLAVAAYAHAHGIPEISAGARDWGGYVAVFDSQVTACLGCLMSAMPDTVDSPGIVGAAAGVIGSWQAALALKYLIRDPWPNPAEYITIQVHDSQVMRLSVEKRTDCPVCSLQKAKGL